VLIALQNLPFYSYLNFFSGVLCLTLGFFVLAKNSRSPNNRLFCLFCLAASIWLFFICFLTSKKFSNEADIILGKCIYTGVTFMPTFALHFVCNFLGPDLKTNKIRDLVITYMITFIFLILIWFNPNFIEGVYEYSWGDFPKGGYVHYIHTFFVLLSAFYIVYLLNRGMRSVKQREGPSNRFYEIKYFFLAFLFVSFGSTDFLHNWGLDFFPVGSVFVALFITMSSYAILKYESLGISLVIKKSLVYSILVSCIASLYFVCVYLIGSFLGDLTHVKSASFLVVILVILTLISNPLERKIQTLVERLFYKKTRDVIEKENKLLLLEMQKQGHAKAVATLAAGMAHEIKNPLTAIKTFTEHLQEKSQDPIFITRFQKVVGAEVDRIDSIVRQVLDFSRPSPLSLENVNLAEILDQTMDFLNADFVKHNIQVQKSFHSNNIFIKGDKKRLKQAFLNLCLNAIQAMPQGGIFCIEASHTDLEYELTMSDTGTGIHKDDLPRIFDPFFTTKPDGTGLGLSIVHGIIKEHLGRISVKSASGKTQFILNFKKL